jgi:hypothetical protein
MALGFWVTGVTAGELAEHWGLAESTVEHDAADASKQLQDTIASQDAEYFKQHCLGLLARATVEAEREKYAGKRSKALVDVAKATADLTGCAAPRKQQVQVQTTDGDEPWFEPTEEKLCGSRRMRSEGFGPKPGAWRFSARPIVRRAEGTIGVTRWFVQKRSAFSTLATGSAERSAVVVVTCSAGSLPMVIAVADLSPDRKPVFLAVAAQAATLAAEKLAARVKELEGRRCATCKHWEAEEWLPPQVGYCGAAAPWTGDESAPFMLTDPSSARTRKDFGCTLWEVKT